MKSVIARIEKDAFPPVPKFRFRYWGFPGWFPPPMKKQTRVQSRTLSSLLNLDRKKRACLILRPPPALFDLKTSNMAACGIIRGENERQQMHCFWAILGPF
jgi:hypothetical protein